MKIKVRYAVLNAGWDFQKDHIRKTLVFGKEYTVIYINRGGWNTDFKLEEHPNHWFNSVFFEEVVEGSLAEVYATLDTGYGIKRRS